MSAEIPAEVIETAARMLRGRFPSIGTRGGSKAESIEQAEIAIRALLDAELIVLRDQGQSGA
jgi:hypothetical protein